MRNTTDGAFLQSDGADCHHPVVVVVVAIIVARRRRRRRGEERCQFTGRPHRTKDLVHLKERRGPSGSGSGSSGSGRR